MMKTMIAENGVTFKELEKNIYKWICQIGQEFTKEFLERYDQMLMKERDKSRYRHKVLSGKLIAAPNCKLKQTFWNQPLLKQSHCLLVIQHDI